MATKTAKLLNLSIDQILVREGFNKRFDYGEMKSLAKSIEDNGLHIPLSVIKTKKKLTDGTPVYELIDGHRRFKALEMISKKLTDDEVFLVRAEEREPAEDELDYYVQMYATGSNQQPLNMLEQADIVKTFIDSGYKPNAIAAKLSITTTRVKDLMILVDKCTPSLRKMVERGQMSATNLLDTLKNDVPADIIEDQVEQALELTGKEKVSPKDIAKVAGRDLRKKAVDETFDDEPQEVIKPKKRVTVADEEHPAFRLTNLKQAILAQEDRVVNQVALRVLNGLIDLFDEGSGTQPVDLVPIFFDDALPANKKDGLGKPPKRLKVEAPEEKPSRKTAAPKAPPVEYDETEDVSDAEDELLDGGTESIDDWEDDI